MTVEYKEYKVLRDCVVGHLRKEGEIFPFPAMREVPSYLEEIKKEHKPYPQTASKEKKQ